MIGVGGIGVVDIPWSPWSWFPGLEVEKDLANDLAKNFLWKEKGSMIEKTPLILRII